MWELKEILCTVLQHPSPISLTLNWFLQVKNWRRNGNGPPTPFNETFYYEGIASNYCISRTILACILRHFVCMCPASLLHLRVNSPWYKKVLNTFPPSHKTMLRSFINFCYRKKSFFFISPVFDPRLQSLSYTKNTRFIKLYW